MPKFRDLDPDVNAEKKRDRTCLPVTLTDEQIKQLKKLLKNFDAIMTLIQ